MSYRSFAGALSLQLVAFCLVLIGCRSSSSSPPENTESSSNALWTNGSFEIGDAGTPPSGWTVTPYLNPGVTITSPQTRAGLRLNADGGSPFTKTLVAAGGAESQVDPSLGSGASLRWPKYGNQVAIVNQLGKNGNANSLSQTMTVASSDVDISDAQIHIRFVVAPVLENPEHVPAQQPYYFVQLTNLTRSNAIMYVDYNASAQPGVPWKVANGYYYTDWQLVDIAPGSAQIAIGDQVKLEVIAAGCSPGGHFGEVYVDGIGSTIPGIFVSATGPTAANAGSNVTYTINYQNGGTTAVAGTTVAFNTPDNTNFQSLDAPGLTCTNPVAGTGGLVTCVVGSLAAGASGSFTVTTQIVSGATGTITEGNYSIYGTAVSPLLGPKVYTTVTSGITYADLMMAMTDNATGVIWGQALSYTITASNPSGPNAVTGATVSDTFPATLTNISWTCVGSNGGSCAASGSGNIADATVGLPVGGSVTYTVNASVVSGMDAGQVANVASVKLPSLAVDFSPNNNAAGTYNDISSPNGTACSVAADCSSGVCDAAGGVCIPVGGCGADSDCASTPETWCNTETFACVAKISNGTAVPTVARHAPALTGACNDTVGTAVCATGRCDAVDNECGLATGHGSCATGAVCRSGACSTNGKCEPNGGCNVDADCAPGNWCEESTGSCKPKIANGNPMPSDPGHIGTTLNATCTSDAAAIVCQAGVCDGDDACGYANADGACTNETATKVCRSGACDPNDFKCGYKNSDGPCGGNGALCRSNICDIDGTCGYGNGDGPCTPGNAGTVCRSLVCATSGPLAASCEQCSNDSNCGSAAPACDITTARCKECTIANSSACSGISPVCNLATVSCSACNGDNASSGSFACPSSASPYCAESGPSAGSCGKCTANADCVGTHNGPICDLASGACGSVCAVDSDCGSDDSEWCDSGSCTPKIANGGLLPASAPINGACTISSGARVCASKVCDSDNRCGIANGDGACTSMTGTSVCRSRVCTTTAGAHFDTCEACNVDGDCRDPSAPACDAASNTCVTCTGANESLCTGATPSCNSATNACVGCGGDHGTTAAHACETSAAPYCAASGACGLCTTSNDCVGAHAGPICDPVSGACGTSCRDDSDCATGSQWCNAAPGATGTCVFKIENGGALPDAPMSVTSCSLPVAMRVCASAICDSADQKCGLGDGDVCTLASQCRIGACTKNFCALPAAPSADAGTGDAGASDGGAPRDGGTWIDGGESPSDAGGESSSASDQDAGGSPGTGHGSSAPGASIEGGGCSAGATSPTPGASAFALFLAAGCLLVRRKRSARAA